ncbi:MAG: glycosyltransferase family 4 protein [Methylomonas sp.]|jgi:glycosyltransferase involved in cell wall biosynthesis|uniref:glycosyltransferase family 4 protein n=1 Tax=Methylomonas sp. TaxID=418 RepID=UPI0025DA060D|nr:glycosyltransferase family 4 protein [Methylomonas sp.]MCK9605991.1 glycosyltransferase family 4 protein [Methylomonas sp.]
MKILYHHRIASKDGQYVHIEEMINSLRKIGHEVVVVEPAQLTKKDFGKSSGAVQSLRSFLPGFIHELIEFSYCFFDLFKLVISILKNKPDCIYERYNLFFISGILAKKLFKLPLVLEVNAPLFFERQKNHGIQLRFLAKWSERLVWRQADYVLPVTHVLAEMVLAETGNSERCLVIPNGINQTKFSGFNSGKNIRDDLGLNDKLILGFVGFVRTWHRLDRVLLSISENLDKNWHLLLIGDGPAMQELQQQSERLGINDRVSFIGVVDRHKVADYVNAFDIALQPDVVEYASPLKLFEYMVLGKAILAPNRKNILEILIDNENALLFNPEEEVSFARQLERLCSSKELRGSLGSMARKTITDKNLFWDENAKKVQGVFMELLSKQ